MAHVPKTWKSNLFGRAKPSAEIVGGKQNKKHARHLAQKRTEVLFPIGPHVPPFLLPLGEALELLQLSFESQDVSQAVSVELTAASEFFEQLLSPSLRLNFALGVQSDQKKTDKFRGHVAHALALLCMAKSPADPSKGMTKQRCEAALLQWNQDAEKFAQACENIREHYTLLLFLDLKGDKALVEECAATLCALLGCDCTLLRVYLAQTRTWARDTLRVFGEGGHVSQMRQLYEGALSKWLAAWTCRTEEHASQPFSDDSGEPGLRFWRGYFSVVEKVSWPDFAQAFEDFFCFGRCPGDLLVNLHRLVQADQDSEHSVDRSSWCGLAGRHNGIAELVSDLVERVLVDSQCIYREVPLGSIGGDCESPGHVAMPDIAMRSALPARLRAFASSSESARPPKNPASDAPAPAADPNAPTPQERPGLVAPDHPQYQGAAAATDWRTLNAHLAALHRPWWLPPTEELSNEELHLDDRLRIEALRRVNGCVAVTRKALLLRVLSGSLAHGRPTLVTTPGAEAAQHEDSAASPVLLVTANGSRFAQATKFGRKGVAARFMPDWPMDEPIVSRSHFHLIYEQREDKFKIMDTGSKWGTFTRVTAATPLTCGNWLKVGTCEFLVRYCGGICPRHRGHVHRNLHSVRAARAQIFMQRWPLCPSQGRTSPSAVAEDDVTQLAITGNAGRRRGWTSAQAGLCQLRAINSETWEHALPPEAASRTGVQGQGRSGRFTAPIAPLELEFLSGPRTGEKVVLTERYCSMGRSEAATIQLGEGSSGSVSRVHCAFEYHGGRWWLRDKSTNGTWRRLSCILEPSRPADVGTGDHLMVGLHEFLCEEVEMGRWWVPSVVGAMLEEFDSQSQ